MHKRRGSEQGVRRRPRELTTGVQPPRNARRRQCPPRATKARPLTVGRKTLAASAPRRARTSYSCRFSPAAIGGEGGGGGGPKDKMGAAVRGAVAARSISYVTYLPGLDTQARAVAITGDRAAEAEAAPHRWALGRPRIRHAAQVAATGHARAFYVGQAATPYPYSPAACGKPEAQERCE